MTFINIQDLKKKFLNVQTLHQMELYLIYFIHVNELNPVERLELWQEHKLWTTPLQLEHQ